MPELSHATSENRYRFLLTFDVKKFRCGRVYKQVLEARDVGELLKSNILSELVSGNSILPFSAEIIK